eukprot:9251684-Pyramimonas_sp.AAC.1
MMRPVASICVTVGNCRNNHPEPCVQLVSKRPGSVQLGQVKTPEGLDTDYRPCTHQGVLYLHEAKVGGARVVHGQARDGDVCARGA